MLIKDYQKRYNKLEFIRDKMYYPTTWPRLIFRFTYKPQQYGYQYSGNYHAYYIRLWCTISFRISSKPTGFEVGIKIVDMLLYSNYPVWVPRRMH